MAITDKQFENEFDVNSDKLLKIIIDIIKENDITSLDMLSIAAKVAKHVENIFIRVKFSDNFRVEDVPDDVIINILDNL